MSQLLLAIKNAIFQRKKIHSIDDLNLFVHNYCAKGAGQLVIKYAQKRLGKIHYNLAKDDDSYAQELVRCQTKIHAELVADIGHLIAFWLKYLSIEKNSALLDLVKKVHQQYINTAPSKYQVQSQLADRHFNKEQQELKKLAQQTGKFLFKLLPMTENLRRSDVSIFQGQVRLFYIQFLQDLTKKVNKEQLQKILQ